jgi:NAD(P)-dependent dehydrogenase (short-subunit alcohol dehydrogenase family)
MLTGKTILVVGGTSGIGLTLARRLIADGNSVHITSRDPSRAEATAAEIGAAGAVAIDLAAPATLETALAGLPPMDHLVLTAMERDRNAVKQYDVSGALRSTAIKLVGYTTVIAALRDRLKPGASIVVFGGLARERPYPGSTSVSMVNGAVSGMVRTLALELAPIRINALHPGAVGDSPAFVNAPAPMLAAMTARTPIGRLVTMAEINEAALFLLQAGGVNGIDLSVDGGYLVS